MKKYAIGDWYHCFGPGGKETRCRIVIDLEQSKLVAAQEWTGLKFEDVLGDRLKNLAESVIDVNQAHANIDEWAPDPELSDELPEWVCPRNLSNYTGQANVAEQGASSKLHLALEKLVPHVLHYASMPHAHADAHRDAADARRVLADFAKETRELMKTFEVTGCGFDGATDETDDRVFWVKALSHDEVRAALAGTKAGFHEIIGSETDIDFHLPVQADLLKGKLLEFEQQGRKMPKYIELTSMTAETKPSLADGEVLGQDADGGLIQWNATAGAPYNSGQTVEEFGISNLSEAESKRLNVSNCTRQQLARISELDAAIDTAADQGDDAFFAAVAAKDEYIDAQGIDRDRLEVTGREVSNYIEQDAKSVSPGTAIASQRFKVLLSLRTACGCVGQGFLGKGQTLTWNSEPGGETVQAIFSRYDTTTMSIVEVVEMDGDDWREFEECHAEAALVANVANGHSLAEALEGVPASLVERESPRPGM